MISPRSQESLSKASVRFQQRQHKVLAYSEQSLDKGALKYITLHENKQILAGFHRDIVKSQPGQSKVSVTSQQCLSNHLS
jgi:hypothetical protein